MSTAVRQPLANKCQYVVNACFDRLSQELQMQMAAGSNTVVGQGMGQGSEDEIFSVKEHELVFRHIKGSMTKPDGRSFSRYSDGRNHVFSALNGLGQDANIALAGCAQGSCSGIRDRMLPQGFAIPREGVVSIINTAENAISIGERVFWRLPDQRNPTLKTLREFLTEEKYAKGVTILGVPRGKRCAQLMGADEAKRHHAELEQKYNDATPDKPPNPGTLETWLTQHRVGYALSRAEPGKQLDLIFQPGY